MDIKEYTNQVVDTISGDTDLGNLAQEWAKKTIEEDIHCNVTNYEDSAVYWFLVTQYMQTMMSRAAYKLGSINMD